MFSSIRNNGFTVESLIPGLAINCSIYLDLSDLAKTKPNTEILASKNFGFPDELGNFI